MTAPSEVEVRALVTDLTATRYRPVNGTPEWAIKGRRWTDEREASVARCSCGAWAWEGKCGACMDRAHYRAARIANNLAHMRALNPHIKEEA